MDKVRAYERMVADIRRRLIASVRRFLPRTIRVVEVSARESRRINRLYRGKNTPANALSFFYDSGYGEILVCPAVIRREARMQKNSRAFQMTWMIAHGMLHLAGLHHEDSGRSARIVVRLEEHILSAIIK